VASDCASLALSVSVMTRNQNKQRQANRFWKCYYQQDSVVHEGGGDANDDDEGI
jgi:hypothetical protein